jgi:phytoene/squalene synthetase
MRNELDNIIASIEFDKIEKHPNILIAARFWDDERFNAAKVCYGFMRKIDDLIDDRKASEEAITSIEKQILTDKVKKWLACLDSSTINDPELRELTDTILKFKIPLQLFHNFARSMLFDIDHNGFSTFKEFLEYAEGASVAPASVFVHLCCLNHDNSEYSLPDFDVISVARPCAIFSYIVHIIRDFQEDQLNNLNYFASEILERNNLNPQDLKEIAKGAPISDAFRNVIREYYNKARVYGEQTLSELENLASGLNSRYLLSLHIIYHLYKQVFDRIDIEKGSFTSAELKPGSGEIKEKVLEITSAWPVSKKNI